MAACIARIDSRLPLQPITIRSKLISRLHRGGRTRHASWQPRIASPSTSNSPDGATMSRSITARSCQAPSCRSVWAMPTPLVVHVAAFTPDCRAKEPNAAKASMSSARGSASRPRTVGPPSLSRSIRAEGSTKHPVRLPPQRAAMVVPTVAAGLHGSVEVTSASTSPGQANGVVESTTGSLRPASCFCECMGMAVFRSARQRSEIQRVDDLARIVRITAAMETQVVGQVAHRLVVGGIERGHDLEAVPAGEVDQVPHQQHAETALAPVVGHGDRAFAMALFAGGAVAADADFAQLSVVVGQCDECHSLVVVDIHQLVDQIRTGLLESAKKPEPARVGRQSAEEVFLAFAILRPQWPDEYRRAIGEGFDPVSTAQLVDLEVGAVRDCLRGEGIGHGVVPDADGRAVRAWQASRRFRFLHDAFLRRGRPLQLTSVN